MFKKNSHRAIALMVALAAIAGCSKQTSMLQAPTPQQAANNLPAGAFNATLKAPAHVTLPAYHTEALAMFPHLIGAAFEDASSSTTEEEPTVAYNSQDDTYFVVWYNGGSLFGRIKDAHGAIQVADFNITALSGAVAPKNPSTNNTELAKAVYIAHLNQFVVVYPGTDNNLYLVRVSASGAIIGTPVPVSTAAGNQDEPDAAYDPINHRLEVVWEDNRSGGNDYDIYGRLLAFTPTQTVFLTNEMLIGNSAPDPNHGNLGAAQVQPTIAFGSCQQRYVVAWTDFRNDLTAYNGGASNGNGSDIYAQVIDANGIPTGSNYPVSTLAENQDEPSIGYLAASDKFLLAFSSNNNGAADQDLLGAGLDGDGSVLGSGTISNQYGMQHDPSVASNNTSMTWLVTYQEDMTMPPDTPPTTPSHIMGRHIGWAFQLGDIFSVTPNNTWWDVDPVAVGNTDDQEFLVDYVAATKSGTEQGQIWGQRTDRGY